MNVFIYEMRQYRKSILSWSIAFAIMAFVFLSATPLFINETSSMKDLLSGFPEAVTDAMGINMENFFSAVGFYSYVFLYISLAASIQAMNLGLGVISKENRMKTADFLLTKPMSRTKIYLQKLLAVLCSLLITEAVFLLSAILSIHVITKGDYDFTSFLLINLSFVLIQMVYFAIGLFVATVVARIKSPISVTMGVCFGTFLAGMVGAILESEALRYFSPLKYYATNYIMENHSFETRYLVLGVSLSLAFVVASYILYVKMDVDAV